MPPVKSVINAVLSVKRMVQLPAGVSSRLQSTATGRPDNGRCRPPITPGVPHSRNGLGCLHRRGNPALIMGHTIKMEVSAAQAGMRRMRFSKVMAIWRWRRRTANSAWCHVPHGRSIQRPRHDGFRSCSTISKPASSICACVVNSGKLASIASR